jgi:hypothetical protein
MTTNQQPLDVSFTDRYDGIMPRPDPLTMCDGECEGMGVVPVFMDTPAAAQRRGEGGASVAKPADETDPRLVDLWKAAEAAKPADDGWHFVGCPDCGGTGKRSNPAPRTLAWVTDQVRKCHGIQGTHGNWNYSPYMLGMFNGLDLAMAILEGREPEYRRDPGSGFLCDLPTPADLPEPAGEPASTAADAGD